MHAAILGEIVVHETHEHPPADDDDGPVHGFGSGRGVGGEHEDDADEGHEEDGGVAYWFALLRYYLDSEKRVSAVLPSGLVTLE